MYFNKEEREKYREIAGGVKPFGDSNKGLSKAFNDYQTILISLRSALRDKILNLPDNPRINRIGEKAFTIKSSDLFMGPWSSFYHDFKAQYKKLAEWIDTLTPGEVLFIIGVVIEKGTVFKSGSQYKFHPDVIEYLKNLE